MARGERPQFRDRPIYLSLELEVADLSDLRALDTLRANKCASLRFHGGRYVAPTTACLFVSSLHDRGTSAERYRARFPDRRGLGRDQR